MRPNHLKKRFRGFTLAELIVVITILAILATMGFLALSGYSQDAKKTSVKSNARSILTAISSESAITGNSPRYYIVHDAWASVSWGLVFVDGQPKTLTGWSWNAPNTNYSAGNPDFAKLKLNSEKFRISGAPPVLTSAFADFDDKKFLVWAVDIETTSSNGKSKTDSWIQVAGVIPNTWYAVVYGNYPLPDVAESSSWAVSWLIRNQKEPTKGMVDEQVAATPSSSNSVTATPTWPTCPVGATCSWAVAEYKTAGSNAFLVPANWTYEILVVGWGWAGGSAYWGGWAGWAGGYANKTTATLTSGQTITITVWAGGILGPSGGVDWTGWNGWSSSVGTIVSANGGGGWQNGGSSGNAVSTLYNTAGGTCWGKSGGGYDASAVKSKGCDGQAYYSTFDSSISHGIGGQPTNNYGAENDAGGGGGGGFWTESKTTACSNWGTAATWYWAGWSGVGGDDGWLACQYGASGYVRITKINTESEAPQAPAIPTVGWSGTTCLAIKTAQAGATSGTYKLDPDGAGGNPEFDAYCDMTNDGGGWTLVMQANKDNALGTTAWNTANAAGAYSSDYSSTFKLADAVIAQIATNKLYRLPFVLNWTPYVRFYGSGCAYSHISKTADCRKSYGSLADTTANVSARVTTNDYPPGGLWDGSSGWQWNVATAVNGTYGHTWCIEQWDTWRPGYCFDNGTHYVNGSSVTEAKWQLYVR